MIGWHSENFARAKRLKPLGDYLKSTKQKLNDGSRSVMALFKRVRARQSQKG
jgi:hypothetical protein